VKLLGIDHVAIGTDSSIGVRRRVSRQAYRPSAFFGYVR